jgi:hypothetical protein
MRAAERWLFDNPVRRRQARNQIHALAMPASNAYINASLPDQEVSMRAMTRPTSIERSRHDG